MLVHSYLPKPPLRCTVGVKIQLLPPSCNLTDKTDSVNVKVHTSMLFSHSNTTHAHQTPELTAIPSLFALKNTSHLEPVTSVASITQFFNLLFLLLPSVIAQLPRYVY